MTMTRSVKSTLLRRSGTRNMFARLVRVLRISYGLLPGYRVARSPRLTGWTKATRGRDSA